MNFTQVAPMGNSSDFPFRFGITADLGQTVYSNMTAYGLMVRADATDLALHSTALLC